MNTTTSTASPDGTMMVNVPSSRVSEVIVVPLTVTVAPAIASPVTAVTWPSISRICASASLVPMRNRQSASAAIKLRLDTSSSVGSGG